MSKLIVKDIEINIISINDEDYICITDMIKAKDGDFFVKDWLRNRNTLEYIGVWESLYNPDFNWGEFATIKSKSGLNSFKISVKEFVEKTNAISLKAKTGRYGGTYAHKDIALEFGMWISAEFKVYLVREYQRLKKEEELNLGWSVRRELTKINYSIHTNAINEYIIPKLLTKDEINKTYSNEADILNMALFGITAKEWRNNNPDKNGNIRDYASINELICLSNLENINSVLIKEGLDSSIRLKKLNEIAISQMSILTNRNQKLLK
ncbi:MAG: KilA-N domain-containing protein [Bacilli bacterium]|nr:KilA-N domain-containing protein [Bacilli bacterium]